MSPSDRASQAPRALLPSADSPRSTAEMAASYIRTLIFSGHLQHGDRINQDELAEALHVSRIPVREAIIALDREGWLTSQPHRGAFVNGFHSAGIEDHYELLGMLFGLAAKRATEHATPEDVEQLIAQQHALRAADDPDYFRQESDKLIRQMFTIADSPRLSAVSRVMTGIVPGNFFAVVPGTISDQKRTTARIVKAIAAHDADRAADEWMKLMRRHGLHVVALLRERNLLKAS
jgi:DNA-binding GntR family transcriptional regulator